MALGYGLKTKGGQKTLNPHARDEFQKGKKINRPKQQWVWTVVPTPHTPGEGHWEKA